MNSIPSNQLKQLKNLELGDPKGWITADLKVVSSSLFGRVFWHIACRFEWMQKTFYGLNLRESQISLNKIKVNIQKNCPQSIAVQKLFNIACKRFNAMTPRTYHVQEQQSAPQSYFADKNSLPVVNKVKPIVNTAGKVSVLTYNILFPQTNGMHENPFSTGIGYSQSGDTVFENSAQRIPIIIQNIKNADMDVNCLQEVTKGVFDKIQASLPGYEGVYAQHKSKSLAPNAHGVAIFYKKHRFVHLADTLTIFQQQKKDENGKLEFYPIDPSNPNKPTAPVMLRRAHLMTDLKDKLTGKITRFVSCHLDDPRNAIGLEKQAHVKRVVYSALDFKKTAYKPDNVVIAGDFNQDQWGDASRKQTVKTSTPNMKRATALQPFFTNNFVADGNLDSTEFERQNPKYFNSAIVPQNRKIDHIYVKSMNSNAQPTYLPLHNFNTAGSDHRAIAACF
jgi:endonuclease/exonuclease/phosphatase family metal-dependent hydrolase